MSQLVEPGTLAYVGGPYSAYLSDGSVDRETIDKRMKTFNQCLAALVKLGLHPCSPLMFDAVIKECKELPGDWEYWKAYSYSMLSACQVLIVLMIPGWRESTGLTHEIIAADRDKMRVIYVNPEKLLDGVFEDEGEQ